MTDWKPGDAVSFTETGTIAHIADGIATVDVRGIPHTMHVSRIIGTPEQAKRERIMKTIEREFPDVMCEPIANTHSSFTLTFKEAFPATYQREQAIRAIQKRIAELEAQG